MKPIIKSALRCMALCAALWASLPLAAQEYEYVPLVREGVKWEYTYFVCYFSHELEQEVNYATAVTLEFRGDSVIGGLTFKKMIIVFEDEEYVVGFMREVDKQVYFVNNPDSGFEDTGAVNKPPQFHIKTENYETIGEMMVYDFNDMSNIIGNDLVDHVEMVEIGGKLRKKTLWKSATAEFQRFTIEGIGTDGFGGLSRMPYHGVHSTTGWRNHTAGLRRTIDSEGNTEYTRWPEYFSGVGQRDHQALDVSVGDGAIRVQLPDAGSGCRIDVFDLAGRLMRSVQSGGQTEVVMTDLPAGIYVVACTDGRQRVVRRVKL